MVKHVVDVQHEKLFYNFFHAKGELESLFYWEFKLPSCRGVCENFSCSELEYNLSNWNQMDALL
jgi:hypothetical protein